MNDRRPAAAPPPARTDRTLRTASDLARAGLLRPAERAAAEAVARRYAIAVTPEMVARIDPTAPDDPIARQFLPRAEELSVGAEERADPIGDFAHSPVKGIVHRYPDRALLKPLHACPVYCRFCFRREQVGPGGAALDDAELDQALAYIAATPRIFEVIVTGGDPLMLSARRLDRIGAAIAAIPHVKVLRFHSRVPIVDPDRIDAAAVAALSRASRATFVAIHANHAREFGPEQAAALSRLSMAGIPLLGQTVLLKGVNDDADALADLFRTMLAHRVKPYYLHHPDLAPGTRHFRLPVARGRELMRALRGRLSGLALPTYVLDIPGGHGKSPIGPDYLREDPDGALSVEDWRGQSHPYPGS